MNNLIYCNFSYTATNIRKFATFIVQWNVNKNTKKKQHFTSSYEQTILNYTYNIGHKIGPKIVSFYLNAPFSSYKFDKNLLWTTQKHSNCTLNRFKNVFKMSLVSPYRVWMSDNFSKCHSISATVVKVGNASCGKSFNQHSA